MSSTFLGLYDTLNGFASFVKGISNDFLLSNVYVSIDFEENLLTHILQIGLLMKRFSDKLRIDRIPKERKTSNK